MSIIKRSLNKVADTSSNSIFGDLEQIPTRLSLSRVYIIIIMLIIHVDHDDKCRRAKVPALLDNFNWLNVRLRPSLQHFETKQS